MGKATFEGQEREEREEQVHSALGGNVPGAQGVLEKQEGVE